MEDSSSVSSVERIVKIVSAISESDRPVGVSALSQQLGMPKATVFRFCNTLAELNVLNKNENDEFSLGLIFVTLGEQVKASSSPAMLAKPFLDELSEEIGESVNLGILDDDSIYTVYNVSGESSVLVSKLIPVSPLYCSSMGKIFLAHMTDVEIAAYFSKPRSKRTVNSIVTLDGFMKSRRDILDSGMAAETEEYEYGLSCMAAPLYGYRGRLAAAMSISAPTSRLELKGRDVIAAKLKKTAADITTIYTRAYL